MFTKSFERYHDVTVRIADRESWEASVCNSCSYEYWGVFEKDTDNLIAYAIVSRLGNTINYNALKAIPELMNKHYPYYGLLYEMNRHYLGEEKVDFVTDGFRSITEHSNIQPFLIKNFLFRKAFCRMRLYYKPWLRLAVNLSYPFRKFIPVKQIQNINRGEL